MTHPIIDDLTWRYATKKYDATRKVSEEDLAVFFEALRLSASSINSQPWKFVVVESEEARERLGRTFEGSFSFNKAFVFDASQVLLFAHNPFYKQADYGVVIEQGEVDGRSKPEDREAAFARFAFVEMNTDEYLNNAPWTKVQTYLALGNALHTLARLRIDATPMEGVNSQAINDAFSDELAGYQCEVALAIGYRLPEEDANASLPKSRLPLDQVLLRV